jgi:hypothetical protein
MRPATAARLAWPADRHERRRIALIVMATGVSGALFIAAGRILRLPQIMDEQPITDGSYGIPDYHGLAPYVVDLGLRPGVVFGALLLMVPVLGLAVQALRIGSLARDRRMAALRLAGATPLEVRVVAAVEAGGAALSGGILAGPAYLGLWVLLGVLPPAGWRLVPAPVVSDALVWVLLPLLGGLGGAAAGVLMQGRVRVDPLGLRRRATGRAIARGARVRFLAGTVLGAGILIYAAQPDALLVVGVVMPAVMMVTFCLAPWLVRASGQRLARRGGAEHLLAGRRLAEDPSSASRVAGSMLTCGLALGAEANYIAVLLQPSGPGGQGSQGRAFYLVGFGLVAGGVAVAAAVAALTLLVGAADQLIDARRPLASLAALGADEPTLAAVLRRQISAVAVPALLTGVVVGGVVVAAFFGWVSAGWRPAGAHIVSMVYALLRSALPTAVVAVLSAAAVGAVARLAARILRSRLREAIDPENLRVA